VTIKKFYRFSVIQRDPFFKILSFSKKENSSWREKNGTTKQCSFWRCIDSWSSESKICWNF